MSELRPLFTVWATWLILMAGANVAAPLYAVYASRFGFSSLVLTAIFTTYAVTLVPTLLLFGRISDRYGRRPVIVAGMAAGAVGLGLFAGAQGTAWLFVARGFQGLAVGTVSRRTARSTANAPTPETAKRRYAWRTGELLAWRPVAAPNTLVGELEST